MHAPSLLLLIGAAGMVAILHSLLPDHWVPLAVVARAQRWNLLRVGKLTFLASLGHVLASLVLGGVIAFIGLQFQQEIDTQQGHIVGIVLVATGLLFLAWNLLGSGPHGHKHGEGGHNHSPGFWGRGHNHEQDHEHDHDHNHEHEHEHNHDHEHGHKHKQQSQQSKQKSLLKRLAAIAVPFGVAASPDLTILPVVLAASAVGKMAVVGVLSVFAVVTVLTFVVLTVLATIAGYQIKGAWIEKHATTITSVVLIGVGIVAFVGF